MTWTDRLVALDACEPAVEWAKAYDTPEAAYAACAREALPIFEARRPGDDRVRRALDLCDRFASGEAITREDMRAAAAAAYAAAYDAYAAAAAAAYADAYAAYAAAAAAADAAAAAAHAVGKDTRESMFRRCAEIVRQHYPEPMKESQ